MAKKIDIAGTLNAATTDGVLGFSEQIKDESKGKMQSSLNKEFGEGIERIERKSDIAYNAVKTLEGLSNANEAMQTLAGQVLQIEENKQNIASNKADTDAKVSELGSKVGNVVVKEKDVIQPINEDLNDYLFDVNSGDEVVFFSDKDHRYGFKIEERIDGVVKKTSAYYSGGRYDYIVENTCKLYLTSKKDEFEARFKCYVNNKSYEMDSRLTNSEEQVESLSNNAFSDTLIGVDAIKFFDGYPSKTSKKLSVNSSYTTACYRIDAFKKLKVEYRGQSNNTFCIGLSNYKYSTIYEDIIELPTDSSGVLDIEYTGYNYVFVCTSASNVYIGATVSAYELIYSSMTKISETFMGKIQYNAYSFINNVLYPQLNSQSAISVAATKTLLTPNGLNLLKESTSESGEYFVIVPKLNELTAYQPLHRYMLVMDWKLNRMYYNGEELLANLQFSAYARDNGGTPFDGNNLQTLTIGSRTIVYAVFSMPSEIGTHVPTISIQYNKKLYSGDVINMDFYGLALIDITDYSVGFILDVIAKEGFKNTYNEGQYVVTSDKAKHLLGRSEAISFWGDSLMNGNYPEMAAQMVGMQCVKNNYGGSTSSTIREQFLKHYELYPNELDNVHIFCVGRNNINNPQHTLKDIKEMVKLLPHQKYIVMSPPNGNYAEEYKGGREYELVVKVGEMLRRAFGAAYFDLRAALIDGYNYGDVKLLSSFVQPQIGETAQISVSDSGFLTKSNTYYPSDAVGHIRIGNMYGGKMNLYKIVTVIDNNTITIEAVGDDYAKAGKTVSNTKYNDSYNNSYGYIDVIQEADYRTFIGDTTPASLRTDNIHMGSDMAQEFTAKMVAREIIARGLDK